MIDQTLPPVALKKAATGIPGLDEITHGGLPAGRPTLVAGGPGSGKTLLGISFLVHGALDFTRELLPFHGAEGAAADCERSLYPRPIELGAETLPGLFVCYRCSIELVLQLHQLLVQQGHVRELFGRFGPDLDVGGATLFDIAEVGYRLQLVDQG